MPDPAGVLDTVMAQENIIALMGNHEDAFAGWYDSILKGGIYGYYYNTYDILSRSPSGCNKIAEYVQWMKGLPYYKKIKVDGKNYLLAHASTKQAVYGKFFSLRILSKYGYRAHTIEIIPINI